MSKRVDFIDIPDLVKLIKDRHNLIISNDTVAEEALYNYSYYTLMNGYKHVLDHSAPANGTASFEHFIDFHLIDTTLNSIFLRIILLTEKTLKSNVSHLVAKNYGVDTQALNDINNPADYLYRGYYSSSSKDTRKCLYKLKEHILDPWQSTPVHYYKNTKLNIPPWILAHNLNLGESIRWYKILAENDKNDICNKMLVNKNGLSQDELKCLFIAAMDILHEYRNKAAHGQVVISKLNRRELPHKESVKFFNNTDITNSSNYKNGFGVKDYYAIILSVFILTKDKQALYLFTFDILKLLIIYNEYNFCGKSLCDIYGFPPDFSLKMLLLLDFKGIEIDENLYELASKVIK